MKILKHSFLMIKKTYANYLLLSVTALLSFSIMFGYLMYTDSEIYNNYKELFSESPNIILSQNSANEAGSLKALTNQLDKLPETHYYYIKTTDAQTSFGTECEVRLMPSYVWGIFTSARLSGETGPSRLMINGDWELSLEPGEAVVSEPMYHSITPDEDGKKRIRLVFTDGEGQSVLKLYEIIGSYSSEIAGYMKGSAQSDMESGAELMDSKYESDSVMNYITVSDPVYVSAASVSDFDCEIENISLTIYTDKQELVIQQTRNLNLACEEIYTLQNTAISEKMSAVSNKYIIAAVLFVLLGINLYSSFANALNDRKFEIGTKRALGAGKPHIMLQFVTEGLAVMSVNIILSVCVVCAVMNIHKLVNELVFNNNYIITLNPESALLFAIFVFFLTLTFSLLFAYQCTRVEIVKYLKEEL